MMLKIQPMHLLLPGWIDAVNYYRDAQIFEKSMRNLQLIQSAAARVLTVMASLHWLPTKSRIDFIVLLLAYEVLCCHIHDASIGQGCTESWSTDKFLSRYWFMSASHLSFPVLSSAVGQTLCN